MMAKQWPGFCPSGRRGMTLIEMLVATTMTLIIMGVVAQLFGFVGNGVSASRASLEVSAQLRSVAHKLRTDLGGITVETLPPVRADSDSGYLEIIEGSGTDTSLGLAQLVGDIDDVLMFTTASHGTPFVGQLGSASTTIESPYAEVAWFCRSAGTAADGTPLYTLHRRQLLVMNYVGAGVFHGTNTLSGVFPGTYADLGEAQNVHDLSLRRVGSSAFPNGLSDLTKRENRFLHNFTGAVSAAAFPYENTLANLDTDGPLGGTRIGEDIVLTNVLAFDVRVFDPTAEVLESTGAGVAMTPGDPGYASGASFSSPVYGAYVDMGVASAGTFAGMNAASQLSNITYDTWSTHYEFNGIDEDGAFGVDQQANGIDDDNNGVVDDEDGNGIDDDSNGIVDDEDEQETSPPYSYPLRGLEVRIRVYEPSSRQVRQVTVRHTFVPH